MDQEELLLIPAIINIMVVLMAGMEKVEANQLRLTPYGMATPRRRGVMLMDKEAPQKRLENLLERYILAAVAQVLGVTLDHLMALRTPVAVQEAEELEDITLLELPVRMEPAEVEVEAASAIM